MKIELSEEQRSDLTIALGCATSCMVSMKFFHFAKTFMDLANHIHQGDPDWKKLDTSRVEEAGTKWAQTQPVN